MQRRLLLDRITEFNGNPSSILVILGPSMADQLQFVQSILFRKMQENGEISNPREKPNKFCAVN
jgi:hypothetical protein